MRLVTMMFVETVRKVEAIPAEYDTPALGRNVVARKRPMCCESGGNKHKACFEKDKTQT
jgi:hypothetical protein